MLHNLGTQQIETLGEDAKRTWELAQIDLILERGGGGCGKGRFQIRKKIGANLWVWVYDNRVSC